MPQSLNLFILKSLACHFKFCQENMNNNNNSYSLIILIIMCNYLNRFCTIKHMFYSAKNELYVYT